MFICRSKLLSIFLFSFCIDMIIVCMQHVSQINSWNIFNKALSDIQRSQTLHQAKIGTLRLHCCSLCRGGEFDSSSCLCKIPFFTMVFALVCFLCTSFQVQYQSELFIDKNKDYVVPEHQVMLSTSKCSFVSGLFPPLSEETAKSAKFSSIGSRFKVSKI